MNKDKGQKIHPILFLKTSRFFKNTNMPSPRITKTERQNIVILYHNFRCKLYFVQLVWRWLTAKSRNVTNKSSVLSKGFSIIVNTVKLKQDVFIGTCFKSGENLLSWKLRISSWFQSIQIKNLRKLDHNNVSDGSPQKKARRWWPRRSIDIILGLPLKCYMISFSHNS